MKHIIRATTSDAFSARERRNIDLAREVASEGFVLLKNEGVLPFTEKNIALYGPGGRMTVAGGGGSGDMNPRYTVSIEEGLEGAGYTVTTKSWLNRFEKHYNESYAAWKESINEKAKGLQNPMAVIGIAAANRFPYPTGVPVQYSDIENSQTNTAVYVLIRQAGEGGDRKNEKGDFRLTDDEVAALRKISEHYKNVLLVINVGGLVDLMPVEHLNIGAILFYAQGGMEGGNAFADVVSGKVNPSGKLACTWAKRYEDYPSCGEYSKYGNSKEQDYKEGIFMGYRYFDSLRIAPRYEFGFGLSYTKFEIAVSGEREENGKILFSVSVKNTGKVAGKEVVQAYVTVPRRACNAEYQRLVAYRKTKLLQPNESQTMELSFDFRDCACYYPAAEVGGQGKWWLNKGDYILRVGISSRKTLNACIFRLPKEVCVEICDGICPPRSPLGEIYTGVPSVKLPHMKTLPVNPMHFKTVIHEYPRLPVYGKEISEKVSGTIERMSAEELTTLVTGSGLHSDNLVSVMGVSGNTTSALYEKYKIPNIALSDGPAGLNVTPEIVETRDGEIKSIKMYARYDFGMFGQMMRKRLGKPEDGVMHYQYATAWPVAMLLAQTWNEELIERVGDAVGTEMEEFGVTVWLAPGINLYRNPLCGRTFEYYSEDPLVAGKTAAAMIRGVQKHEGRYCSVKHFACNNHEADRDLSSSNINERALRELYLKAFRIAVEESAPRTVMASYNKINGIYNTNNYDLLVKVLRNEWGFQGLVMSDWNAVDIERGNPALAMQAQCDLLMPGKTEWKDIILKALAEGELSTDDLKRCAARVLQIISENRVEKY